MLTLKVILKISEISVEYFVKIHISVYLKAISGSVPDFSKAS